MFRFGFQAHGTHKASWLYAGFSLLVLAGFIISIFLVPLTVQAGNVDNPLEKFQTWGACVDTAAYKVAVAGVGMSDRTSGTISLNLPTSATNIQAWLYWTGRDPSTEGDGTILFQGTPYAGLPIGGPAFWDTNDFAFAYRADVSSAIIPGNSTYTVQDGLSVPGDTNEFTIPYGAALVVVYQDTSETTPNIVEVWANMDIAEGSSSPPGSEGVSPVTFEFEPAAVNRTAYLSVVVGGITSNKNVEVYYLVDSGSGIYSGDIYTAAGVQTITLTASASDGFDDNFMTTYDFAVSVPAGATRVIVQLRSPDTNGAQLHWLAQTFQMEAACPRVEVTKTRTSPAIVHTNDTVTFSIEVRNTGNTRLDTVPVTDTFNVTHLDFLQAQLDGSPSSPDTDTTAGNTRTLTWNNIGPLNPNQTRTLELTFRAGAGTQSLPGDVTVNTATVNGAVDQNGATAPSASDTATVEISNPALQVEKRRITPSGEYVPENGTVRFEIEITNTGDTTLTTVSLEDTFSTQYLEYVSASPAPSSTAPGTLTWNNLGPLAPGSSTTVQVEFRARQTSWNNTVHAQVINTASATAQDENGDSLGPEQDTAFVRITRPHVTITKEVVGGDTHVPINDTVTYRVIVTNSGDTVLETIPVRDTFPTDKLDYSSTTLSTTPSVDEAAGTLEWSDVTGSNSLAPGASLTFEITFQVTGSSYPNTITNQVCVFNAVDENNHQPEDVCDDDSTIITTMPQLDITKVLLTSSPVLIGDTVQFKISIVNTGNTSIDLLPLVDTFDNSRLEFVNATPGGYTYVSGSNTITWSDLADPTPLAPGNSVEITLTFTAIGAGNASNEGSVENAIDEFGDPVPADSDSAEVTILTPARVGNLVWEDIDGDGLQEAGESGLNNVTVRLYTHSGTLVATTTTDSNGLYEFDRLFPGQYYIEFVAPPDYEFTFPNQGGDDTVDSDADPGTGRTPTFTLAEGDNQDQWDAGLYRPASVGNFVWHDVNGNGLQDSENGVNGVTVHLYYAGPDGIFDASELSTPYRTTVTSGGGLYSFTNLPPGKYRLKFIPDSTYNLTFADQGTDDGQDSDPDPTTGQTIDFALLSGESQDRWDAGVYEPVTIGDRVWADTDGGADQDPGESGINNVSLTLRCAGPDGTLSTGDDIVRTTQTATQGGQDGIYAFTDVPPGLCQVEAATPGGYVPTTPTTLSRTLTSGETWDTADFGFISPTSVDILTFNTYIEAEGVVLTWRTRSEEGVTFFVVQRSISGKRGWRSIAAVVAQGTPYRGATYQVLDTRVTPGGRYFYRLVTIPAEHILGPWAVEVPATWTPAAGVQNGQRLFVPMITR